MLLSEHAARNTDWQAWVHLITDQDWIILEDLRCNQRRRDEPRGWEPEALRRWLDTANL